MTAAIALAECYSYLGHSCFTVSKQQFCAVINDGVILLSCAWQESRYINERYYWNVEAVTEADKAGAFAAGVAIQHAGKYFRLVCYDTYGLAVEACEAYNNISCKLLVYLKERVLVYNRLNYFVHIIRLVGVFRQDSVQLVVFTTDRVCTFYTRCFFHVVLRQI